MQNRRSNTIWSLIEIANIKDDVYGESSTPMQLFHHVFERPRNVSASLAANSGSTSSSADHNPHATWILSGFHQATGLDTILSNWFYRSVERGVIRPNRDIFVTPISNPFSIPESEIQEASLESLEQTAFMNHLYRWAQRIQPKLIVTLSLGSPIIRYLGNIPQDTLSKMAYLSEKSVYAFGEEPIEIVHLDEHRQLSAVFGHMMSASGTSWIDIGIDREKKDPEEFKNTDWRTCLGPMLKWLIENDPFHVKTEVKPKHEIIGVMELPPQFAQLH